MEKNILNTNIVTQVGILVNDIEKSSQDYADFFGIEKPNWMLTDGYDKTQAEYMGKPSNAKAKLAFFNVGPNMTIELIEPDNEPSTWRDDLNKYGEGVHHIAFAIKDMKEKIEICQRNGMPLLQKGEYTGGRYAYIDANNSLKTIIELLEND